LGQLAVMRHLISGIDWAIAGAAMVAAPATPNPVTLIKSRRLMMSPSCGDVPAFVLRLGISMEHPVLVFHAQVGYRDEKTRLQGAGLVRSTT
jgi:hypothetical protein